MCALCEVCTHLSQNIEHEWLNIKVERLVVEEELGEQTQALTVDLLVGAVHFVNAKRAVPVDVLARRLPFHTAQLHMQSHTSHVLTKCIRYVVSFFMYLQQYSHMNKCASRP
jgi:hypothetical protein